MTDPDTSGPLIDACIAVLGRLGSAARPDDSVWRDLDVTMSQLKAMFVLTCHGSLTVGGLARALGITEPSASLLADKLEGQGLAAREADPDDRRRTLVVPTSAALEMNERLRQVRNERMADWLVRLEDDDLRALLRGATALLRAVEASAQRRAQETDA